jgi:hypothetical protein
VLPAWNLNLMASTLAQVQPPGGLSATLDTCWLYSAAFDQVPAPMPVRLPSTL